MWIGQWTCIFLNGGSLVISPTVPLVHHKSNKIPFNICRNVIPRGQGIEPNSIINCRVLTAYCLVINWFIVKHCIGVFSPEGGGVATNSFESSNFVLLLGLSWKVNMYFYCHLERQLLADLRDVSCCSIYEFKPTILTFSCQIIRIF